MTDALVEFSAVSKRYRRRAAPVLDGVSLRVEPGSLTEVLGANGSGKSTLLRLAAGFVRPSRGRVYRTSGPTGFVPDHAAPPERMRAGDYLAHLGRMAGADTSAVARALAERLGLVPGLDAPLGTLSRGNLRKVLLIQSLARPVDLVLWDEPFTALDAPAATELAVVVGERLEAGCAFLVATHTEALGGLGRRLVVADGALHEASAPLPPGAAQPFTVYLAGPQPPGDLPREPAPGGVRHTVPPGHLEAFLQAAIGAGARVLRVQPADEDERGHR